MTSLKPILLAASALLVLTWASAATPVTTQEASATMAKLTKVVRSVLRTAPKAAPYRSAGPVASRESVINFFSELLKESEEKLVIIMPEIKPVAKLTVKGDAAKRADRLIRLGFIDKLGPLVTSKNPGLTVQEFGDAVGLFLSRLAEMTHVPTRKFSPALMPNE